MQNHQTEQTTMLIIDARHPAIRGKSRPEIDWPAPICVVVPDLRDDPLVEGDRYDPDIFVFECAGGHTSRLAMMRDVVINAQRSPAQAEGPLLFLTPDAQVPTGKPGDGEVLWELGEGQDVTMLMAGPKVTAHPMFGTFFNNMASGLGAEHTEGSLKMMRTYLAS